MIRPKIKFEDILLSTTKNCEMRIKQTHKETEETSEIKTNKARETFHFRPPIPTKGSWITRLTNLEVLFLFLIKQNKITNFNFIQTLLMNFHLQNQKMNLRKYLVFQILHHTIYNMK